MGQERTLSIIKPDAVAKNIIGAIYTRFEEAGLSIIAAKMLHLSKQQAAEFYTVHRERPFYQDLIEFMTSGPVLVQVLEGENAIARNRELMGATFPKDATPGTIRADFCDRAGDQGKNAVHGSDSAENAEIEINFFFSPEEICERIR
ncbi:MAG: nucleoside-diphosphate kinase [Gammaproteobacteria bacterium]